MNPTDVSNAVNAVINAYPSGSRIGFSGVEVGQCPAPVCEYMVRLGAPIPPMYGGLADGWGKVFPPELAPYFIHEGFEPGKQYPEGTIYMWDSPHIAFSVAPSDGSNTVKVFEQNADPDGAGCQVFNRTINTASHTCTYALIPITQTQPLPPTFDTETITPKKVQLTTQTAEIDLSQRTTPENYPIAEQPAGYIFTAVAIYHHVNGLNYYAPDLASPGGYLWGNCQDYVPPPPVPYVPPAAPEPVNLAKTIDLETTVPTYATSLDAQNRNADKSNGTFPKGTYAYFPPDVDGMKNIALANQSVTTVWINPKDNVPPIVPPVPEQVIEPQVAAPSETAPELDPLPAKPDYTDGWKASYIPFYPSQSRITKSIIYTVKKINSADSYLVLDLGGTGPEMELIAGTKVAAYGKFTKDDVVYYRLRISKDTNFDYWYGVPITFNGRAVLILPAVNWLDRLFNKGQELKSIFTEGEPKYIDSVLLKAFKRRK